MSSDTLAYLQPYQRLGLSPVPLKRRSKEPPVRCGDGLDSLVEQIAQRVANPKVNISVSCTENLAIVDCDSEETFCDFATTHDLLSACEVTNTGRSYHICVKPRKPIRSQRVNNVEVKRLGSHVLAAPQSTLPVPLRLPGCLSTVRDFAETYCAGFLNPALLTPDTAMVKAPISLEVIR